MAQSETRRRLPGLAGRSRRFRRPLSNYKATSHFVIDSRETPSGLLADVEDILYGTEINSARMPLVSELVTMFQSNSP
jgi:hypothetical protein